MTSCCLAVREQHQTALRRYFFESRSHSESVALLTLRRSSATSLEGQQISIYSVRDIFPVASSDVSASACHVTWNNDILIPTLKRAASEGLVVGIAHSHMAHPAVFSDQDARGEAGLIELVQHRNGSDAELVSLVYSDDGSVNGRVWFDPTSSAEFVRIREIGQRYAFSFRNDDSYSSNATLRQTLARQALAFGHELNRTMSSLTFGIVGCGGTGSAVAMLLARLGAKRFFLIDQDKVEVTNLNRLHGATHADALEQRLKVEVAGRHIHSIQRDALVVTHAGPVNDQRCWGHLKACDVVLGCTDDNRGRLLLNRLAYFYLLPVVDMGLAIEVSRTTPPRILSLDGRVTCLGPGEVCLLCRGVIDVRRAREEALQHADPDEYARQKDEAYVFGEGDPSPSVVTFTTEVATMALNELIHRLQGFRGLSGGTGSRTRLFHRSQDLRPGDVSVAECAVCADSGYWGLGDTMPFLDQVW